MKKVFMIVQKKDFVPSLEEMRALGVVHVEHNDVLKSDDITAIKDDIQLLEQVIRILENAKTDHHAPKEALDSVFEWREVTECVLHQMKKIEVLSDNILKRQGLINKLQKWGNFEPQDISHLKEKGINVSFCEIPVSQKIVPKEGVIVEVLSRTGGINNCMVITTGSVDPGHEGIVLPAKSLSHEHDSQEKEKNNIKRAEDELKAQVKYLPALKRKLREKEEKLVFKEVIVGAKNTGELTLLKGYCPQKTCSQIETKAKEHQWGILFEDPSEEDKVPTLLENPKWVSVINPLINFIGILPGYKEVDINPFLLLFFSLFVGILVGDAGYGFIYLLTCAIAHFAMRKKVKDPLVRYDSKVDALYILTRKGAEEEVVEMAPGVNLGDRAAVFEAVHGSAPKYRGMNKVNPTAMILSGVMLLEHLGEQEAASRLEAAVRQVLREGRCVTYDLKPTRDDPTAVGTGEMADAVIAALNAPRSGSKFEVRSSK